jgi:hypothetical protein
MADAQAFEFVCNELERLTKMTRLEARGTVRLALKEAGLAPATVRAAEMQVVLQKVMPRELNARGIQGADAMCQTIAGGVGNLKEETGNQSPEAVFSRLAGG